MESIKRGGCVSLIYGDETVTAEVMDKSNTSKSWPYFLRIKTGKYANQVTWHNRNGLTLIKNNKS